VGHKSGCRFYGHWIGNKLSEQGLGGHFDRAPACPDFNTNAYPDDHRYSRRYGHRYSYVYTDSHIYGDSNGDSNIYIHAYADAYAYVCDWSDGGSQRKRQGERHHRHVVELQPKAEHDLPRVRVQQLA
jgi:hypothetical protein